MEAGATPEATGPSIADPGRVRAPASGPASTVGAIVTRFLRAWSAFAAAGGVGIGGAVLVGWVLGVPGLTRLFSGFSTMKANTAASLLLLGLALWILRGESLSRRRRALADGAAGLVVAIAGLTLLEHVAGVGVGVDQLIVRDPWTAGTPPGRMSPFTATCLLMLAVALLTVDRPSAFRTGQRVAVGAGAIAYCNLIAHAYSLHTLRLAMVLVSYAEMAPHTAGTLLVLSGGVAAVRPRRGATGIFVQETAGGALARRLLPVALLAPFLVGWLGLTGARERLYGREFGVALIAAGNILLFSFVVWWTAVRLHRTDVRRQRAEAELREANQELDARVRARTAALAASEARYRRLIEESAERIVIHQDGIVRLANPAAVRLLGHASADHLVGRPLTAFIAPAHRADVAARVEARLRGDAVPPAVQIEILRRDGSLLWIEVAATVVDWDGAPAIMAGWIDVSERRRREAAEREAETLRSVAQLANATAHEINNPLTTISGNLELLGGKLGDGDGRVHIERCRTAVRRIVDMIGHMRRITRLEGLALRTGGAPTLDLRQSAAPPDPPAAAPERPAP